MARLDEVLGAGVRPARVLVVDSLGDGRLGDRIRSSVPLVVDYRNHDRNLGSAGNLERRVSIAADEYDDCRYVFAINHDGHVDESCISTLMSFARERSQCGAVYPTRLRTQAGSRFEPPKFTRGVGMIRFSKELPETARVLWSSSNGALYSLAPARRGIRPWADLWMGWEDAAYGFALDEAGFDQWQLRDAVFEDDYEYRRLGILGFEAHYSDKPAWTSYYFARNLWLTMARFESRPAALARFATRMGAELGVISLLRDQKLKRLGLALRGSLDGFQAVTGRGPVP